MMPDRSNEINALHATDAKGQGSRLGSHLDELSANSFEARYHRLKVALNAKTDTEIGRVLGLKQSTVSSIHTRKRIPANWFIEIGDRFGISTDWLLYGEGQMMREDRVHAEDSGTPTSPEPKSVPIEHGPLERFRVWMGEMVTENKAYLGWFTIELPKRFPEFQQWLEKKQRDQSSEDSDQIGYENTA